MQRLCALFAANSRSMANHSNSVAPNKPKPKPKIKTSRNNPHDPKGQSAFMACLASNTEQTPCNRKGGFKYTANKQQVNTRQRLSKHQVNTQPTRAKNQQPTVSSEITCKKSLIWFTIIKKAHQSKPAITSMTSNCLLSLASQPSNPTKQ